MRIRFEVEGKEYIKDIPDELVEQTLVMHKKEDEEIKINNNAFNEVDNALRTLEEQVKVLKTNIEGLRNKINESQKKIDEPL